MPKSPPNVLSYRLQILRQSCTTTAVVHETGIICWNDPNEHDNISPHEKPPPGDKKGKTQTKHVHYRWGIMR